MAASPGRGPLKLRATDQDDLSVIAACLQDALVPIGDMTFQPENRRFVLVANRFRWEAARPGDPAADEVEPAGADETSDVSYDAASRSRFERTNCGLRFERVTAVRTRGVDLRDRGQILELLTLRHENDRLVLVFAGGATIVLELDGLQCFLEDIGEPWPTWWRPAHPVTAGEGPGE